jgi:hypothetical protein
VIQAPENPEFHFDGNTDIKDGNLAFTQIMRWNL